MSCLGKYTNGIKYTSWVRESHADDWLIAEMGKTAESKAGS